VVVVGIFLPLSPLAGVLGFDPLPTPFFLALLGMIVVYLVMVEFAKSWFFARAAQQPPARPAVIPRRQPSHHISRRAARFSTAVAHPLHGQLVRGGRKSKARSTRSS
jgi:Mg2+-importing ATPase